MTHAAPELFSFLRRPDLGPGVYDLHLLDEGRLARLSSACRIKLTFKVIVVSNHLSLG